MEAQRVRLIFRKEFFQSKENIVNFDEITQYFSIPEVESGSVNNGMYVIHYDTLPPIHLHDYFYTGLIQVTGKDWTWHYAAQANFKVRFQQLCVYFNGFPGPNPSLSSLIINYESFWKDHLRLLHDNEGRLTALGFEEFRKSLEYLKKHRQFLLALIFEAILYYLINDKSNFQHISSQLKKYSSTASGLHFRKMIENILSLLDFKIAGINGTGEIHIITETDSSLTYGNALDEKQYLYGMLQSLKEITGRALERVSGDETSILNHLIKNKYRFLLLFGHGNPQDGYSINSYMHPKRDYLSISELQKCLANKSKECINIIDMVCSGNHFISNSNYKQPVNIFCNAKYKHGTFNAPSGYYYCLGFFKKYLETNDIKKSHETGQLTLAMFDYEYMDTYAYYPVP